LKPSTAVPLFAGQVILAMSVSSLVDVPASYAHADIGSLDQSIHVGKKTGRNQMLISSWSVPTSNPNAKDQCCVVRESATYTCRLSAWVYSQLPSRGGKNNQKIKNWSLYRRFVFKILKISKNHICSHCFFVGSFMKTAGSLMFLK